MISEQSMQLVPYAEDPLARLATRLLSDHRARLPRLDGVTVLLPDLEGAVRLRELLLHQAATLGVDALLGPRITTLRGWLNDQPVTVGATVVNDHQRMLILVEALREHRGLFGDANLWALADSLLQLFDELTLNQVELPADLPQFAARIAAGYGLTGNEPAALDREARLVHTLWHAWHQQLHARELIDQQTHHLLQLSHALQQPPSPPLYLVGLPTLRNAERRWLGEMLQTGRLTLLLHGEGGHEAKGGEEPPYRYHPRTPLCSLFKSLQQPLPQKQQGGAANRLFDTLYHPDDDPSPLRERARRFATQHPTSPIADTIKLFHADGDEQEARAVELQVRRWLLAGHRQIGIVSENRRLARRLRALLERAGVALHDASGWALSTTSAAAVLEHWLQCIEEDFSYQAMLDLLKSPFIFAAREREEYLAEVYRLEQDIVLHENIGSGLGRYLRQTRFRQHRLPTELAAGLNGVLALLECLSRVVQPLLPLLQGEHPASRYLDTLLESLAPLGLAEGLAADAAGRHLLDTLQQMQRAVRGEAQPLSWLEFRGWLGRTLEQSHFRLASPGHAVTLMGLGQSQLQRFDALIIAGMEREFLPGSPAVSPFFNDAVRRELGLPCGEEQLAERLFHFRRLLEAAPHLLLTLRQQQDGEEILPSPWLASLRSFHLLAYADALEDIELAQLLASPDSQVVDRRAPLPTATLPPAPALATSLLPQRYSASAYQQLMDCPYQFYAARGLRLAPPEAIREALQKSDYGERVHRILQAFHGEVAGLPGPFRGKLDERSRHRAQLLLEEISRAVFAVDLEDNFLHRGWLQRWLEKIPGYLDWQLQREQEGEVESVEVELCTEGFAPQLELQGRIDRIDRQQEGVALLDYKTGGMASEEEVLSGEAVQLPFYALLADHRQLPVAQVEYLALDGNKLASKVVLRDAALAQLRTETGERLQGLQRQMANGQGLPAWGDEGVCGYCPMEGLCRRGTWPTESGWEHSPA
ncbi:MAG: PD-(D/E)XK nuclease family protein [Gammaproteobacteria bacterium]|nr:PD-(D/E)XK nuclease family protein [Gammaproteobacteria bacterium]